MQYATGTYSKHEMQVGFMLYAIRPAFRRFSILRVSRASGNAVWAIIYIGGWIVA